MTTDAVVDVVIAGAGPNGLMVACELSLAGVRPIVLDRLPTISTEPRANGLVGQVVRMLDRRGLHERLSGGSEPPEPSGAYVFGALPLDLSLLVDNPIHLLPVPQRHLTQVLEERAVELGVEIRRGHELVGLAQDDDAVTVTVAGPDEDYSLRARYLVGADGGHSVTRTLSGIGFPGVTTDRVTSRTANATLPAEWIDPATGALSVPGYGTVAPFQHHRTERGLFVFAHFPGREPMVSTMEWDESAIGDEEAMTVDEMAAGISRVLGVAVPLGPPAGAGPHLLRRGTSGNTRLAERFSDRRVLLVGDAAHVHSAMGGPGLNLGLQDAVNLGWKLATVLRGRAAPELLDSYDSERLPVARRVVMHTLAQSALIAPGSEVTALRELFAELLGDRNTVQHIADLLAGADVRYPMPAAGTHPLVGRWAPDMVLRTRAGTVRLAELTRTARPLLLDTTPDGSPAAALSGWRDRVDVVTGRPGSGVAAPALLLRPDCYVAWASASARPSDAELAGLRSATQHWFGAVDR